MRHTAVRSNFHSVDNCCNQAITRFDPETGILSAMAIFRQPRRPESGTVAASNPSNLAFPFKRMSSSGVPLRGASRYAGFRKSAASCFSKWHAVPSSNGGCTPLCKPSCRFRCGLLDGTLRSPPPFDHKPVSDQAGTGGCGVCSFMVGTVRTLEFLAPLRILRTVFLSVLLVRHQRPSGRLYTITMTLAVEIRRLRSWRIGRPGQ
jgi:hypothetical protein